MQEHPIWRILEHQGRSMTRFAELIGYSFSHVKNVRYGIAKDTPKFRAACSLVLGLPESVLFLSAECPSDAPDVQKQTDLQPSEVA